MDDNEQPQGVTWNIGRITFGPAPAPQTPLERLRETLDECDRSIHELRRQLREYQSEGA